MNLASGAYTTTLLVMVDRVKGGGREPRQGWTEFLIMMEVRQKVAVASLFVLSRLCTVHCAHVNLYTFIPKIIRLGYQFPYPGLSFLHTN